VEELTRIVTYRVLIADEAEKRLNGLDRRSERRIRMCFL
jgi:hypothetical protein